MADETLVRELTVTLLEGAADSRVAAFVVLLDTMTGGDRDADEIRQLARMSAALAYTRTNAFRSQFSNFVTKHKKKGKGGRER